MSAELLAKTLELKGILEGMQKNVATKAELAEATDKMAKDFNEIQKGLKESVTRIGTPGDYHPTAVKKLVERGVTSIKDFANLGSLNKKTAAGMTSPDSAIDQDEREVIELGERVALLDALMTGDESRGADYARRKQKNGEKEAFTHYFPKTAKAWNRVVDDIQKTAGLLDTTTATLGAEWVNTVWGTTMEDQIRLAVPTLDIFRSFQMPAKIFKLPIKTNVGDSYVKTEATAITVTDPNTTNVTFTAVAQGYRTTWSDEISEDSVIPILPFARADAVRALAEGRDRAIVSGETEATHMDADYEASAAGFIAFGWNGLRQYALIGSSLTQGTTQADHNGGGTALTSTVVLAAAATMGKYAANMMNDVVLLVSTKEWLRLLGDSNLLTVDKFGARATILNGQLGFLAGIPVLIDNEVTARSDISTVDPAPGVATAGLDTNGFNVSTDASNVTRTAILVNRNAWLQGDRRPMTLETDKTISTGVNELVMTSRWDFAPIWHAGSWPLHTTTVGYRHTVVIRNILT